MSYFGIFSNTLLSFPTGNLGPHLYLKDRKSNGVATRYDIDKKLRIDSVINVADFYEQTTNEAVYADIVEFVKDNNITEIPLVSNSVKVSLDYTLEDIRGNIIDEGVRIIPCDLSDSSFSLDIDNTNKCSYRASKNTNVSFNIKISRKNSELTHFAGQRDTYVFIINDISVRGGETGNVIGPSLRDTTMRRSSSTVSSVYNKSILLFSSLQVGMNFEYFEVPSQCNTIEVMASIILPICKTANNDDITIAIQNNRADAVSTNPDDYAWADVFDPIITRPPCPGKLPHDVNRFWDDGKIWGPLHHTDGHGHSDWKPLKPDPNLIKEVPRIDPDNITAVDSPGLYSESGRQICNWSDLLSGGYLRNNEGMLESVSRITKDIKGILVISSDITSLSAEIFFGFENLKKVYIPASIVTIPRAAFYLCKGLTEVFLPTAVRSISDLAFSYCNNLIKITLPDVIESIGNSAFLHCTALRIQVPTDIQSVGEAAFHEVYCVEYLGTLSTDNWGAISYIKAPLQGESSEEDSSGKNTESGSSESSDTGGSGTENSDSDTNENSGSEEGGSDTNPAPSTESSEDSSDAP